MKYKIMPEIESQMYAMIAWNGKTKQEAEAIIEELYQKFDGDARAVYEELDKSVYANDSILAALFGINKNEKELKTDAKYDKIIEILTDIHDKWVKGNTKKYDRGTPEKSKKNIFQHLPTELIGIDEVSKDLMFLAPFLKEIGIDVGEMQSNAYGAFVPNKEIKDAYNRAVIAYLKTNGISTLEDLKEHLPNIIANYEPLQAEHPLKEKRLEYMNASIDTLVNSVESKQDKEIFDSEKEKD